MCVCVYIYIYIYRSRNIQLVDASDAESLREIDSGMSVCMCDLIYTFACVCMCIYISNDVDFNEELYADLSDVLQLKLSNTVHIENSKYYVPLLTTLYPYSCMLPLFTNYPTPTTPTHTGRASTIERNAFLMMVKGLMCAFFSIWDSWASQSGTHSIIYVCSCN